VTVIANRLKQLIQALRAKMTEENIALINKYLSGREKDLFNRLDLPTRKHCVLVAGKCLELSPVYKVEPRLMAKAALLHDIGKGSGNMSIIDRSLTAALDFFCPWLLRKLARPGRGNIFRNFRHAAYIYLHHPALGADLLKLTGTEPMLIELTALHHQAAKKDDPPELELLRKADGMF